MVFLIPLLCDLTLMWIAIGIRRQIHQPHFYKAILMDVPPHVKHIALLFAEVGILLTCHLFLKVSTHDHGKAMVIVVGLLCMIPAFIAIAKSMIQFGKAERLCCSPARHNTKNGQNETQTHSLYIHPMHMGRGAKPAGTYCNAFARQAEALLLSLRRAYGIRYRLCT